MPQLELLADPAAGALARSPLRTQADEVLPLRMLPLQDRQEITPGRKRSLPQARGVCG